MQNIILNKAVYNTTTSVMVGILNSWIHHIFTHCILPSVLWHCCFGVRKSIQPVKYWVMCTGSVHLISNLLMQIGTGSRCIALWPIWIQYSKILLQAHCCWIKSHLSFCGMKRVVCWIQNAASVHASYSLMLHETKPSRPRTRLRPKFWPRGQFYLSVSFLTYSSYTSQSMTVVTTVQFTYLLHVSHVTHQNLIRYISAISKPIHFRFSPKLSAVQGLQS